MDATRHSFLGRLGPSLEPIISQPVEGKTLRKEGHVRELLSILEDYRIFSKPLILKFFDHEKLENHCFEKQAPESIPPGSALMACLAHSSLSWLSFIFVSQFLRDAGSLGIFCGIYNSQS